MIPPTHVLRISSHVVLCLFTPFVELIFHRILAAVSFKLSYVSIEGA